MLMNETALITGGTGAIGSCFAKALLNAGARVAVLGRGKTVPVSDAVRGILNDSDLPPDAAGRLSGYACDVSDEESFQAVLGEIKKDIGIPTILINAAGGNKGKAAFVDVDVELFNEVVQMNLLGGLVVPVKHTARLWIDTKTEGTIINIASMASYVPLSGVWAYGASKSGVMNLTAGLAKEFAVHRIRVNGIAPGFFVGNQNRDLLYDDFENDVLSARGRQIIGHTPFGRFGKIEELNGTLVYLCDKAQSGFVTGVTIPVDGGYLIDNI